MFKSLTVLIAALGIASSAAAQSYPSRPISLIVPFAAGGTVNLMGRLVSTRLGEVLGQSVVVENKGGGGGSIGAAYVAKSAPDGYTLLLATMGQQSIQPAIFQHLPYDAHKDFAPVALFATVPNVLAVSADTPASSIAELVEYAKKHPGKLNMGSAGIGSVNHLTGELFMFRSGAKFTHVPYKGAGPATNDLMAGQIQILFANLPNVLAQAKAGKVRILGVASAKRSPALPDVPTFAEAGVTGAEVDSWYAFMAPSKTDPAIIRKLEQAVIQVAREPEMVKLLADQGAEPFPGTSADLTRISAEESKRWAEVTRSAKIQLD